MEFLMGLFLDPFERPDVSDFWMHGPDRSAGFGECVLAFDPFYANDQMRAWMWGLGLVRV